MKKEDCFELGYISKTHGLNGEMTIFFDVDDPTLYYDIESLLFDVNDQIAPYFIEYIHPTKGNKVLIKFEEIDNVDQANKYIGTKLFLPLGKLPKLEEGQYYYHQLIEFIVQDKNHGKLGTVKNIITGQKQNLLEMEYMNKEVLIPITDEVIINVDLQNSVVETELPTGLLEVYLD